MDNRVYILDTTLRDGQQGEDVNFSAQDMLRIAERLDEIGVHFIEGGWPGSNPRFDEFFELARKLKLKNSQLVAFGKTRNKDISVEEDEGLKALLAVDTPAVAIFGKSWKLHVKLMNNTLKENLRMIYESVKFLKEHGRTVIYDAEHFFDAYKDDGEYALKTLKAAHDAGADWLTLCDTNGGTLHFDIEEIVAEVRAYFDSSVKIGIHAHNDGALGVANTLSAVRAGTTMVQGTINGYGERCGNADLTAVIPNLQLKMGKQCISTDNLVALKKLSGFVSELATMTPFKGRPFVGRNAFAHKGGIHVSAVNKDPKAYEHISPELVGNYRRIVISDLAGKSNIESKIKELGIDPGEVSCRDIADEIKKLEALGYKFENADDSLRILVAQKRGEFRPLFRVKGFNIVISKREGEDCSSIATVEVENDEGVIEIAGDKGNGPVGALDNALRKALTIFFPTDLGELSLVDFKVMVVDATKGTGAPVRALVESRYGEDQIIRTVGASPDVVEASFRALMDSFHAVIRKNGNGAH